MFKAYIGALSTELPGLMDAAESTTAPVPMSGMSTQKQQESIQLAYTLAQTFMGSRLQTWSG